MINVSDKNFNAEVLNAEQPVLVDVWAPWCGPCKMVGPAVERLAEKNKNRFKLAMANIEECEKTADTWVIKSTPTLILFKGGQEIARRTGAMMESQIDNWLDKELNA